MRAVAVGGIAFASLSASAATPDISGGWLRPLTTRLIPCEDGTAAWGWDLDPVRVRWFAESTSNAPLTWSLSSPIVALTVTEDCLGAWIELQQPPYLAFISRDRAGVLYVAPGVVPDMINKLEPDGSNPTRVWFDLQVKDELYSVQWDHTGLRSVQTPVPLEEGTTWRIGAQNVWFRPLSPGLSLLRDEDHAATAVAAYRKLDVAQAEIFAGGRAVVLMPSRQQGVFIATDGAGESQPLGPQLLKDANIYEVYAKRKSDVAWMIDKHDFLYGIKLGPEGASELNGGQPIAVDGVPLELDSAVLLDDGAIWALPKWLLSHKSLYNDVVRVAPDGARFDVRRLSTQMTDPEVARLRKEMIRWIGVSNRFKDVAFVKAGTDSIWKIDLGAQPSVTPLDVGALHVDVVVPGTTMENLWLPSTPKSYQLRSSRDVEKLQLRLGSLELDAKTKLPLEAAVGAMPGECELTFKLPSIAEIDNTIATVVLQLKGNVVARGSALLQGETTRIPLLSDGQAFGGFDRVTLDVGTAGRASIHADWPELLVLTPWWKRVLSKPGVRAGLWIFIPTLVISLLLGRERRSWAPVFVPGIELLLLPQLKQFEQLDGLDMVIAFTSLFASGMLVGTLSPPALRVLSGFQPFTFMAGLAIGLGFVRKRNFRSQLDWVEKRLTDLRTAANNEVYVSLPLSTRKGSVDVDALVELLSSSNVATRQHVLIQASAGKGKSALLRELAARLLANARKDANAPIPVLVEHQEGKLLSRILMAVEGRDVTAELTEGQLARGHFVILVDGMNDADAKSCELEAFLRGPQAESRLCITCGPTARLPGMFERNSDAWELVSLDALNEQAAKKFVGQYARELSSERVTGLLKICRTADGKQLPLLLRLGTDLEMRGAEPVSIFDLYEKTLFRMLRTGGAEADTVTALADYVESLCRKHYWEEQHRTFPEEEPVPEALKKLKACGLLVANEANEYRLRFFHDSFQSFITARCLKGTAKELLRAAGHKAFTSSRADLLPCGGSELYQMCLIVWRSREEKGHVQRMVTEEFESWKQDYRTRFSTEAILAAAPDKDPMPSSWRTHQPIDCLSRAIGWATTENRWTTMFARLAPQVFAWSTSDPRHEKSAA